MDLNIHCISPVHKIFHQSYLLSYSVTYLVAKFKGSLCHLMLLPLYTEVEGMVE